MLLSNFFSFLVAEVVPLKQGLKQIENKKLTKFVNSCRGSSIKTRIETTQSHLTVGKEGLVAEVVPLKQGLKHIHTI